MNAVQPNAILIVVYGTFSPQWTTALAAYAPVWRDMPDIGEVVTAPDEHALANVIPARDGVTTVILPLTEVHTLTCLRHFHALIPDQRAIAVLGNKATFSVFAKTLGLSHLCPKTYANDGEVEFPCVVKRLRSNSGLGIAAAASREHMRALLADWRWRGQDVTVQALVPGSIEYVTHCVCKNGKILWHGSFAYDLSSPGMIRSARNSPAPRLVAASPRTLAKIESFLTPLAYSGPCNTDYKLAFNGDISVFEINPQLGGSLMRRENVGPLREALTVIVANARPLDA
jgi:carbamoylphosphate synthase large subunit